jgi:hypothetical protein
VNGYPGSLTDKFYRPAGIRIQFQSQISRTKTSESRARGKPSTPVVSIDTKTLTYEDPKAPTRLSPSTWQYKILQLKQAELRLDVAPDLQHAHMGVAPVAPDLAVGRGNPQGSGWPRSAARYQPIDRLGGAQGHGRLGDHLVGLPALPHASFTPVTLAPTPPDPASPCYKNLRQSRGSSLHPIIRELLHQLGRPGNRQTRGNGGERSPGGISSRD